MTEKQLSGVRTRLRQGLPELELDALAKRQKVVGTGGIECLAEHGEAEHGRK